MLGQPADGGRAELLPIERRPFQQVGDLGAVGRVVDRELLVPGPCLDLWLEHHGS